MKQEDEKAGTMSFSEMEVVGDSPPLSERPMLDGCQSYTNKTLSASPSLQRDEAKAESKSNEGDDSPTCSDLSLGSNDPATLPPTNTIGHIDWKNGEFVAQRNADVGFAQAPMVSDQTIEQTFNRPTKVSGGIIGVSLQPAAVEKWLLAAHRHAALTHSCQEQASVDHSSGHLHEEWHTIRLKADTVSMVVQVDDITWLAQIFNIPESLGQTWLLPGLDPGWLQQS